MVLVKGGCFEMGSRFENELPESKPLHPVCLGDYYLGETEVTQALWVKTMGRDPFAFFRSPDRPVEEASWEDAHIFIRKLNEITKKNYRLPTEAEWEYAARERGQNKRWSGTDDPKEAELYAWFSENSKNMTHPVKEKRPNLLGLYDMSGNVWEWVEDRYDEHYYSKSPRENPKGPSKGKYLVLRGGSYNSQREAIRVDYRFKDSPDKRFNYFCGFRLALSPPEK
jgi:formylglycine-generating enzyme required for sulfatase activity